MDFIAFDFPLSLFLPEKVEDWCSFPLVVVAAWEPSDIGEEVESLASEFDFSIAEVDIIRIDVDFPDCFGCGQLNRGAFDLEWEQEGVANSLAWVYFASKTADNSTVTQVNEYG